MALLLASVWPRCRASWISLGAIRVLPSGPLFGHKSIQNACQLALRSMSMIIPLEVLLLLPGMRRLLVRLMSHHAQVIVAESVCEHTTLEASPEIELPASKRQILLDAAKYGSRRYNRLYSKHMTGLPKPGRVLLHSPGASTRFQTNGLEQIIVARSLAMQCETNLIVVDSNLLHKLACLFNLEELKFREESWTQAQAHADDGVHRCKREFRYLSPISSARALSESILASALRSFAVDLLKHCVDEYSKQNAASGKENSLIILIPDSEKFVSEHSPSDLKTLAEISNATVIAGCSLTNIAISDNLHFSTEAVSSTQSTACEHNRSEEEDARYNLLALFPLHVRLDPSERMIRESESMKQKISSLNDSQRRANHSSWQQLVSLARQNRIIISYSPKPAPCIPADQVKAVLSWAVHHRLNKSKEGERSRAREAKHGTRHLVLKEDDIAYGISMVHKSDISKSLKPLIKPQSEYEARLMADIVIPDSLECGFEEVAAQDTAKQALRETLQLPFQWPALFARDGPLARHAPKGILLFGPPGTGKTLLARAAAAECGATFLAIQPSSIASKWMGDSVKYVRAAFSLAKRLAPSVIFLDEADALLGRRDSNSEHEALREIRNEFMTLWDGLRNSVEMNSENSDQQQDQHHHHHYHHDKDSRAPDRSSPNTCPNSGQIIVLGATNRPFDIDEAILRRFSRRILCDLPNKVAREQILKIHLKSTTLASDVDLKKLSEQTNGHSGSDLRDLACTATMVAVREMMSQGQIGGSLRPLTMADFQTAIQESRSSISEDSSLMIELRQWNDRYGTSRLDRQPKQLSYFS